MNHQYLIVLNILFLTINVIHSTCLYCQYIYHQYLLVISISCNIEYTMIPPSAPWLNQILWWHPHPGPTIYYDDTHTLAQPYTMVTPLPWLDHIPWWHPQSGWTIHYGDTHTQARLYTMVTPTPWPDHILWWHLYPGPMSRPCPAPVICPVKRPVSPEVFLLYWSSPDLAHHSQSQTCITHLTSTKSILDPWHIPLLAFMTLFLIRKNHFAI